MDTLTLYRQQNPRSRAQSLTPLTRNGTCKRERTCVVCGSEHSECGKYPQTRHMTEWRWEHDQHRAWEIPVVDAVERVRYAIMRRLDRALKAVEV